MTGWVVIYRERGKPLELHSIKATEPEARRVAAGLVGQATYHGRVVRADVVRVELELPA